MIWGKGITSKGNSRQAGLSFRRKLSMRKLNLPVRSNCTEVTTSTGAEETAGEYRKLWKEGVAPQSQCGCNMRPHP